VRGGSVTPPARLFLFHARDRVSVLVVGGTPMRRLRVAHGFHCRSRLVRGPFVLLSARRDEAVLRGALHAWLCSAEALPRDPIATAEHGTLFIDSISALSTATQRLLLAFTSGHLNATCADSARPWTGRLIAGDGHRLLAAVRRGRFAMTLFDALDKVTVELPAARPAASPLSAQFARV
jgi:DNA-binding NtrC family response regulator